MVDTLCSSQAVIDKATVSANATIIASGAIISRYINEAEGLIVGETRIGYVTGYGSVNDQVKQLLSLCCSAHAAFMIVDQDTTGFYSRQVSDTTLNVLFDQYTKALAQLRDLDTNKIRDVS